MQYQKTEGQMRVYPSPSRACQSAEASCGPSGRRCGTCCGPWGPCSLAVDHRDDPAAAGSLGSASEGEERTQGAVDRTEACRSKLGIAHGEAVRELDVDLGMERIASAPPELIAWLPVAGTRIEAARNPSL